MKKGGTTHSSQAFLTNFSWLQHGACCVAGQATIFEEIPVQIFTINMHFLSRRLATICRAQPASNNAVYVVCGGRRQKEYRAFFRAHTHHHERGIHLHSHCLPHSHVSSLLLLMNTCAAINPFFMC